MSTGLLVVAVVLVVLAALWAYSTAHRLDRLHVRTDSAWVALESALGRRAAVVRATAVATPDGSAGGLAVLADRAERADRTGRERAENALSAALRERPPTPQEPALVAELADAEVRVQLARRFHNDAVRDTLALRSRRPVRLLRLGGTAPQPAYFELSESLPVPVPPRPRVRPSARVLLLDEQDRVLLLRGTDRAAARSWWFTTGGGQEPGEHLRATGVREVEEETGLRLAEHDLHGPVWTRTAVLPLDGELVEAQESFFVARVRSFTASRAGWTELERATVLDVRWCGPGDVRALEAAGEQVYPAGLDTLLAEAVTALDGTLAPAPPRVIT